MSRKKGCFSPLKNPPPPTENKTGLLLKRDPKYLGRQMFAKLIQSGTALALYFFPPNCNTRQQQTKSPARIDLKTTVRNKTPAPVARDLGCGWCLKLLIGRKKTLICSHVHKNCGKQQQADVSRTVERHTQGCQIILAYFFTVIMTEMG